MVSPGGRTRSPASSYGGKPREQLAQTRPDIVARPGDPGDALAVSVHLDNTDNTGVQRAAHLPHSDSEGQVPQDGGEKQEF